MCISHLGSGDDRGGRGGGRGRRETVRGAIGGRRSNGTAKASLEMEFISFCSSFILECNDDLDARADLQHAPGVGGQTGEDCAYSAWASESGTEVGPESAKGKKGSKRYDEERGGAEDDHEDDSTPGGAQRQAKGARDGIEDPTPD